MEVTVVGYWGGYPDKDGATSCYLVESDGYTLVLDLGSAGLSKLQEYKDIQDIDAVIISHYHADHTADIGVLQYALLVQANVLGNDKIVPIYGHSESERDFQLLNHDYTKAVEYDPQEILNVGPFSISFFKTKHSVPCYGMKITDGKNTMVYTADTAYDEGWIDFSKNADLLITDCNFYAGMNAQASGHMTSSEGADIADKAGVENLILSHLPQFGDLNQLAQEAGEIFNGKIVMATEGLQWNAESGFIKK